MMNVGFTLWNHAAGNSSPNTIRSTRSRANRLNDEAACSKPAQKIAAPTNSRKMTNTRFFSTVSRPPNAMT